MSYWTYRLISRSVGSDTYIGIHEVHYRDDGSMEGWTAKPCWPSGEGIAEVKQDLEWMMKALDHPVLEVHDEELVEVKHEPAP